MDDFSSRLNQAIKSSNITAAELADITGISPAAISCYRRGKYLPKQENILKIAKVLNVSFHWLSCNEDYNSVKAELNLEITKNAFSCYIEKLNGEYRHLEKEFEEICSRYGSRKKGMLADILNKKKRYIKTVEKEFEKLNGNK